MLAIARVCRRVCLSAHPSVTSRCFTETAKCRITKTTPHDSPGISNGTIPNGGAKFIHSFNAGAVAENGDLVFDAKRCQLSSIARLSHWASILFVCSTFAVMQRVARVCQRELVLVLLCCTLCTMSII